MNTPISLELALGIALTSRQSNQFLEDLRCLLNCLESEDDGYSLETPEQVLNKLLQNGRTQIIHDIYGFLCVEKETYPGKYFIWKPN